ncbi:MAG TPA: TonB-dependent receptor plug domain-containing protein [Pseudomonadales bacterium]|nr:TonB-dependent receptor plug domain-containing protein [Pseudomonadales bacterium]
MKKLVGIILLGLSSASMAEEQTDSDFAKLELEDLMNIQVTSASKKDQRLAEAATAIYVLDQNKLKRSGATTVMDALRLVPGLNVARVGSHTWAISARGFNGRLANKLLVLIDGRTVYSPLFSGVNWQVQDLILDDIDRIEVIRGPGATIWGANAVNGVINIITKKADQTQGNLASALAGSFDRDQAAFRHGGKLGDATYYRAYVKHAEWGPSAAADKDVATLDEWNLQHAGIRIDSQLSSQQSLTVQADTLHLNYSDNFFVSSAQPFFRGHVPVDGDTRATNLMARWENQTSRDTKTSAQFYIADIRTIQKKSVSTGKRTIWNYNNNFPRCQITMSSPGLAFVTMKTKPSLDLAVPSFILRTNPMGYTTPSFRTKLR